MIDPILTSLGLFVGTLVGLTGVGGGALLTPLLILVVGVRPMTAIGTDLAFAAITKGVGAIQHQRHGTSDFRLVFRLAIASIPGALLGAWFISVLDASDTVNVEALLTRFLGVVLLVSASASLLRIFGMSWAKDTKKELGLVATAGFGVAIGFMVGMTSVGAGSILMAVLAIFYGRLAAAQAVGVDVTHGAVLAAVAAMAHGASGRIEIPMVVSLLIGSIPGVMLGSWLCSRLPGRPLRVGIAAMLAVSGAHLLWA